MFGRSSVLVLTALVLGGLVQPAAAQRGGNMPLQPLGEGPFVVQTAEGPIRVNVVTRGLSHPWSMTWLPDGNMLVTERSGSVRIVRDGVLDPEPISGVPTVHAVRLSGLMDVLLHPDFEDNQIVYLSYTKNLNQDPLEVSTTVARGRLVGNAFVGMEDILVADIWAGNVAVSAGDDGAFVIDDQFAPMTGRILDAIGELTDQPVRYVLNTHWHGDHTGGNVNLGELGYTIVAHDNVRARMETPQSSLDA